MTRKHQAETSPSQPKVGELSRSVVKRRVARAQQRLRRFIKPGRLLSDELIAERRQAARDE